MTNTKIGLLFIASYLLGGIPTGYIIGRLKGIDIRKHGSCNPGTANVYRTLGKWPGILTFVVDFLKGFAPTLIATRYFFIPGSMDFSKGHWWIPVTAGALAIAGHIWTVFLGLRGGKGVATSAGVFMALLPVPTAGQPYFRGLDGRLGGAAHTLLCAGEGLPEALHAAGADRLPADLLHAHRQYPAHPERGRAFVQTQERG